MVRISKVKLSEKILLRIYRLFFEVFSKSRSQSSFSKLMNDILTPTEKIMLAKRIGILYLLIKNVDNVVIADILKVSSSTVSVYSVHSYKRNTEIVRTLKNLLAKEKILDFMDDIFSGLFIQPGLKKGHYKLKNDYELQKLNRKELRE